MKKRKVKGPVRFSLIGGNRKFIKKTCPLKGGADESVDLKKMYGATENNDMDLTEEERRYVERFVRRLEKDARQWKFTRWLILLGSVVFIAGSGLLFNQMLELQETLSDIFTLSDRRFLTPETIELFVTGTVSNVRIEMAVMTRVVLNSIVGGAGFIFSIANWNRHLKSAIKAKLLKKALSEAPSPPASGGPTAEIVTQ